MCESSHFRGEEFFVFGGWFFLFSWKTTGKRMIVKHSELTVLCCSSGTTATYPVFPKNRRSFAWKRSVRELLLLDLAYLELRIQATAIYFRAHMPRFITGHDVIDVFRHEPTRTNFFDSQMFMLYLTYVGPINA